MTIQKQGWLQKQGGFVKSWKKRWMVLYKTPEKTQILYYADKGRTALKGTIDLKTAKDVKAVTDNDKRFLIVCADRTWRLEATDLVERTTWVDAVRNALQIPGETSKKADSVVGPDPGDVFTPLVPKIDLPGDVPDKSPVQPGTAIQVINGKVSDAGIDPLPEKKRDPAAANEEPAGDFDKVFGELCSLLDENHDDVIHLKEFSEMYPEWAGNFFSEFFNNLDEDQNQNLSKEELKKMFTNDDSSMDAKRVHQTIKQIQELKFDKIFDDVCLIIDKNYDDKFDFQEFSELYPEASNEFYKGLDLNKDQFLSKSELKEYYRLEDGTLDTPRVTKDYAKLEESIYLQEIERLCQMVSEDHAKDTIDISEFKSVYPSGTKEFIQAIGAEDAETFEYDTIVKAFRDDDGWGNFVQVQKVIVEMKGAMFDTHFEGLCTLMDKNHNDTIDVKEFSMIYPTASEFFFKQLDTNGDQSLQKEELRQMFVIADGSMDVERMAQIEADMKEKIAAKNAEKDAAMDDFLDGDENEVLEPAKNEDDGKSPSEDFEEFEEVQKTPEKKAEEPKKAAEPVKEDVKVEEKGEVKEDVKVEAKAEVKDEVKSEEKQEPATVSGIGPRWTWDPNFEKPEGKKDMGSYFASVYTEDQQARLGCDEMGNPVEKKEQPSQKVKDVKVEEKRDPTPAKAPESKSEEAEEVPMDKPPSGCCTIS